MDEIKEVQDWLVRCKLLLAKYEPCEVVEMAILVGFERPAIYEALCHLAADRRSRTSLKTRLDWHINRELDALEPTNLKDAWFDLMRFENGFDFQD